MTNFSRAVLLVVVSALMLVHPLYGQTPAASSQDSSAIHAAPPFDIVSIKPNKTGSGNMSSRTHDGSFAATNISLKTLLSIAYGFRDGLISGVPGWAESARFDIDAKIEDPDVEALKKLRPEQRRAMLVPILKDRFHVRVHTETKIRPEYELVVIKDGPKFKKSAMPAANSGTRVHNYNMTATAVPISSLTDQLSAQLDRTVVDKTGLKDTYDLHLKWTPEQAAMAGPEGGEHADSSDAAPSLFTALQEQLGLKLLPVKGPVATLIVDHADPPTEN